MKIQGPNSANLNPYQRQLHNQQKERKQTYKDELNISKEAQQLQKTNQAEKERAAHVQKIKKLIDSDEYEMNYNKVAQKMIDFWTNRN